MTLGQSCVPEKSVCCLANSNVFVIVVSDHVLMATLFVFTFLSLKCKEDGSLVLVLRSHI